MHSCLITSLLQNGFITTSNNLTNYLSVAHVSLYSTRRLNIRKLAKSINFGSDAHIADAKTNPFVTFGPDIFAYLKHIGVLIKEKTEWLLPVNWQQRFYVKIAAAS